MSNPSSWPDCGLRKPNCRVPAETPTLSRPSSWIAFIVDLSGIWPGGGSGPSGAYGAGRVEGGLLVRALGLVPASLGVVVGGAVTSGGAASCGAPQAVSVASTSSARRGRRITGTPGAVARSRRGPSPRRSARRPARTTAGPQAGPLASSNPAAAAVAALVRARPTSFVKASNVAAAGPVASSTAPS